MNIKMKSLTIKKCFVLLLLILSSNISVAQDCLDSESYYQYIKNNGQPHLEYVLDKIRSHSVVAIGEDHWIDAHPQFLCELITASAKDSTANIDAVAVGEKLLGLMQTIGVAFADFSPGLDPFDWLVGIVGAVAFRLLIYFKSKKAKKFRRDEEYGSARWSA